MGEGTGRKLLRPSKAELMFNVCIGGRKSSTLVWSKGLGAKKRTSWCWSLCRRKALRNGLRLLIACQAGLGSSAERDGTTIWTPRSKSVSGAKKKSGFCSSATDKRETSGRKSRCSWKAELTIQLRTTGIRQWRRKSTNLRRSLIKSGACFVLRSKLITLEAPQLPLSLPILPSISNN